METTDVVTGNYFNKYEASNPIARRLVSGFMGTLRGLLAKVECNSVHEIGCGEGFLGETYAGMAGDIRASDLSEDCIAKARQRSAAHNRKIDYSVSSIYDLQPEKDAAELVICCEVLEHLEHPERAIEILSNLSSKYLICSVPREPLWRILNFGRGKYWSSLGNTPGHLQHFSSRRIQNLIGSKFEIQEVRQPLPWTFILASKR